MQFAAGQAVSRCKRAKRPAPVLQQPVGGGHPDRAASILHKGAHKARVNQRRPGLGRALGQRIALAQQGPFIKALRCAAMIADKSVVGADPHRGVVGDKEALHGNRVAHFAQVNALHGPVAHGAQALGRAQPNGAVASLSHRRGLGRV